MHSFKAVVQDDKILVTADPKRTLKDNKSRALSASFDGTIAPGNGTIIVGGGAGAIHTVESLREACLSSSVDEALHYSNQMLLHPEEWLQGNDYHHKFREKCTY